MPWGNNESNTKPHIQNIYIYFFRVGIIIMHFYAISHSRQSRISCAIFFVYSVLRQLLTGWSPHYTWRGLCTHNTFIMLFTALFIYIFFSLFFILIIIIDIMKLLPSSLINVEYNNWGASLYFGLLSLTDVLFIVYTFICCF